MRYGIGIDLGGTNVKFVSVSEHGQIQTIGNSTLAERSAGRFTSTRQLVEAHLNGDENATKVWLESLYNLAAGITSVINAVDPEVIIIGGGIAQAGSALFDPLERFLEKMEWRPQGQRVRIIPAALGDFAGTVGAAYYAMSSRMESDEHNR